MPTLFMTKDIIYRKVKYADTLKLSVLYKQVYIQTYRTEGVSDEFANFITRQFAVERLEHIITNYPENIIAADYKSNLLGVAEIGFAKKCPINNIMAPELNKLYILERFCGLGIGGVLLKEAEKTVFSQGAEEIWLWVLESNDRAIAFYKKQGYQHIGNASFQMEVNKYENEVMLKQLS